jgi:deazaflavin-dependent oxidoreductase (nitroreductase family)
VSAGELKGALQGASQVDLTVTGRKSGRESTRPIWFVDDGDELLLMPVGGRTANWYRNIVQTREIRLAADGAKLQATAKPVEDSEAVADTLEKFGAKYGADQVARFYPDQDAFVEVPLS